MSPILGSSTQAESPEASPSAEAPRTGGGRSRRRPALGLLVVGAIAALALRRFRGGEADDAAADVSTEEAHAADEPTASPSAGGGRSRTGLALVAAAIAGVAVYRRVRRR